MTPASIGTHAATSCSKRGGAAIIWIVTGETGIPAVCAQQKDKALLLIYRNILPSSKQDMQLRNHDEDQHAVPAPGGDQHSREQICSKTSWA